MNNLSHLRLERGTSTQTARVRTGRYMAAQWVVQPTAASVPAPPRQQSLTFGEFIAGVYDACGGPKARGIVQLAVNAHVVEFRGRDRYLISQRRAPGAKRVHAWTP